MSHVDDATLHELVDDELDPAARRQVEAHLAACGECARRFAEATAMARQVVSLLTALDEDALPKLMVAPVVRREAGASVTAVAAPARMRRLPALQRFAIAAGVMLVAGVSYQVGKRGDSGSAGVVVGRTPSTEPVVLPAAVPAAKAAAVLPAAPVPTSAPLTALRSAPSAPLSAAAPVRTEAADREAMRAAESRAVASAASRADAALERRAASVQESRVAEQLADAPAPRARVLQLSETVAGNVAGNVVAAPSAMRAARSESTLPELAGYATVEERAAPTVPAITRRRYVSASGMALVLTIVPGAASASASAGADATASPQYVVSSSNGRSTVRWQAQGNAYELQGALPADSLMKLATQLK